MPGTPELVAPAGDWEALVAAVQNGADAVYLGGKSFNARQSAANFDDKELVRAIEYAHVRGVKVYVTVNTLVADEELEKALRFLLFLQNSAADAVIIQDLGLAALARTVIPELPLHASTQMTIHNSPATEHILKMGFKRVVLAREMSLEEIKRLKDQTKMEIEVFIHGALCICYSGQCLFSSMVGGRSGNRGRCAQPCRLQYELVDRQGRMLRDPRKVGRYLLSPRDLNLSQHLPDLIQAGIDAFKIEGRMKRPEYVAVVTRIYRKLINRALELGPDAFYVREEEARELAQIFNREFTTGYSYRCQGQQMMSYSRPNNRGVFLGRVLHYDNGYLQVDLEDKLNVGDGLEVWVTEGGRDGFEVKEILLNGKRVDFAPPGQTVKLAYRGRARAGDRIFKTHDRKLIERARATFASPKEMLSIPVKIFVKARIGEPLSITVQDKETNTGKGETQALGQVANKRPLTASFLYQQLNRLGNTPFYIEEFNCDLEEGVIYPAGEINEARRQAIAALEQARVKATRARPVGQEVFEGRLALALKKNIRGNSLKRERPLLAVFAGDLASLEAAVNAGADLLYFGGETFLSKPTVNREDFYTGFLYCKEHEVKFILATPRIIKDGELPAIYDLLREASRWPVNGILVRNLGLLEKVMAIPFYTDYALNVFNSQTCDYFKSVGAGRVTLSLELTREQIKQIVARTEVPVELLVHGGIELMVSEHCVLGSVVGGLSPEKKCMHPCRKDRYYLKDRLGMLFPVEVDQFCRTHIFNSRELSLLDNIRLLTETGVGVLRIDARRQEPDYVYHVTRAYRQAIDQGEKWPGNGSNESIERFIPTETTTGHFFRGVE